MIDSGLVGSTDFRSSHPQGHEPEHHESRRCSRDSYPESYITKYTSIRRNIEALTCDGPPSGQAFRNTAEKPPAFRALSCLGEKDHSWVSPLCPAVRFRRKVVWLGQVVLVKVVSFLLQSCRICTTHPFKCQASSHLTLQMSSKLTFECPNIEQVDI